MQKQFLNKTFKREDITLLRMNVNRCGNIMRRHKRLLADEQRWAEGFYKGFPSMLNGGFRKGELVCFAASARTQYEPQKTDIAMALTMQAMQRGDNILHLNMERTDRDGELILQRLKNRGEGNENPIHLDVEYDFRIPDDGDSA